MSAAVRVKHKFDNALAEKQLRCTCARERICNDNHWTLVSREQVISNSVLDLVSWCGRHKKRTRKKVPSS